MNYKIKNYLLNIKIISAVIFSLMSSEIVLGHPPETTNNSNSSFSLAEFSIVLFFIVISVLLLIMIIDKLQPNEKIISKKSLTIISTIIIGLNSIFIIKLYVEV